MKNLKEQFKKTLRVLTTTNNYKSISENGSTVVLKSSTGYQIKFDIDEASDKISHSFADVNIPQDEIEKINNEIKQASIF